MTRSWTPSRTRSAGCRMRRCPYCGQSATPRRGLLSFLARPCWARSQDGGPRHNPASLSHVEAVVVHHPHPCPRVQFAHVVRKRRRELGDVGTGLVINVCRLTAASEAADHGHQAPLAHALIRHQQASPGSSKNSKPSGVPCVLPSFNSNGRPPTRLRIVRHI
jgi:hypothetical protein